MKNMKTQGIFWAIFGVMVFMMGKTIDTRELIGRYRSSFGQSLAEFTPAIVFVLAYVCFLMGIYLISTDMKPVEKRSARVLATKIKTVTVEFDDGTRKVLVNWKVPVVAGDNGMIVFKGNFLMEFVKQ